MEKQKLLECIVGYLPYGVKCVISGEYDNFESETISTINSLTIERDGRIWCDSITDSRLYCNIIEDVFPILRPLSDLTNSCLEGGKVPIEEIRLELALINGYHDYFDYLGYMDYAHRFKYYDEKPSILSLPCYVIQLLYKWHFDIHSLIEKGYAIDINTLNE